MKPLPNFKRELCRLLPGPTKQYLRTVIKKHVAGVLENGGNYYSAIASLNMFYGKHIAHPRTDVLRVLMEALFKDVGRLNLRALENEIAPISASSKSEALPTGDDGEGVVRLSLVDGRVTGES